MAKPQPHFFEPSLVARIAQGLRYIATGTAPGASSAAPFLAAGDKSGSSVRGGWFGPGAVSPASQAPAEVAGRAFDYPTAYNAANQPRAYEALGFRDLRALAESWDLLRLVIETRKDQLEKLDWSIKPRAASGPDARCGAIQSFLRAPDREHDWGGWLRLLLEDLFVIDAPTLYIRRDRAGRLHALEVVDGATIKRVLDDSGRTPAPPAPAYRQILKGVPAVDYTSDELLYLPRNPRPHKVYGCSPVEQIALTVNIALRRALSQLHYYTEGNVPEALIGVPESWTPDQIRQFQLYWDALMEGNSAARRHARFIPGDMKYQPTREPALKDQYDEWLARIACYAFSVSPTPFIAQVNRATAESAQSAALQEGLAPLQSWVKRLVDLVLAREFAAPDLEFAWAEGRAVDPAEQAKIDQIYVQSGVKSVDEVRAALGLSPIGAANAVMGLQPYPLGTNAPTTGFGKYSPDQPRVPAGGSGGGQWTGGGDDNTQIAQAGPVSSLPPKDKRAVISRKDWDRFNDAVARLPNVTDTERYVASEIFGREGGFNPGDHAYAGITPAILDQAKTSGLFPELAAVNAPAELSAEQTAKLYRYYLDTALGRVGGVQALDAIGDPHTAAAVGDVLFREGATGGARIVRQALDDTITSLPDQERTRLGITAIGSGSGRLGPQALDAIVTLSNSDYGEKFRSQLANARNIFRDDEANRNNHFRPH